MSEDRVIVNRVARKTLLTVYLVGAFLAFAFSIGWSILFHNQIAMLLFIGWTAGWGVRALCGDTTVEQHPT